MKVIEPNSHYHCRNKRFNSYMHMQQAGTCTRTSVGHDINWCVCVCGEKSLWQAAKWVGLPWSASKAWLQCCSKGACWTQKKSPGAMSRLLVGVLFVCVSCSVLYIGRAGAQAVQVTAILGIINMVLKEHLWKKKNVLLCYDMQGSP